MTITIHGLYFDGTTSRKTKAVLRLADDGMVGVDGVATAPVLARSLVVSPRIGNTARYIEFPDGAQFETLENDAVDRLCATLGGRDRQAFIHRLESHGRMVLGTVLVVLVSAWGFVKYGVPALSHELALLLPPEASSFLGEGVLAALDEHWLEPSTLGEARQEELRMLFAGLSGPGEQSAPLAVEFRAGGAMQANALALPDGTVVLTDELIELAADDREIAAVMLHEVGHVHHRHSLRAALQQFSLAMLVMIVTGDVSASSSVVTALPVLLLQRGYSRDMEWEADGYALGRLGQHGVDPEHFATLMEKLEARYSQRYAQCVAASGRERGCLEETVEALRAGEAAEAPLESYLSTHPLSRERIARFRSARG